MYVIQLALTNGLDFNDSQKSEKSSSV